MPCLSNWTECAIAHTYLDGFFFARLAKKLGISCVLFYKSLKYGKFCYSYDQLLTGLSVVLTIRSVIILVIKQIGLPLCGGPILSSTCMITDRIGLHSVLLPLFIQYSCRGDFSKSLLMAT